MSPKPSVSSRVLPNRLCRRFTFRRRLIVKFLICCVIWTTLESLYIYIRLTTVDSLEPHPLRQGQHERIFISSTHWNNEPILRSHWNNAVTQVVQTFGPDRIFVSVVESGSWDDTKGALRDLDAELDRLGARRNITLSQTTHQDEISVVPSPEQEGWMIRLVAGESFVGFRTSPGCATFPCGRSRIWHGGNHVNDVAKLLDTNHGDYAAACSLDFSKPPLFYDTFALRDDNGDEHMMQMWPFFRAKASRAALLSMSPVPVRSCWNGMVAMPTEPFTSSPPLRFRAIPDSLARFHLEASECCLIHADNPLSRTMGVFLNPRVRVGYSGPAYGAVHPARAWVSLRYVALALWENRLRRWAAALPLRISKTIVQRRVAEWKRDHDGVHEPGEFCLVDEMQVLVANGWAHV